ncbi:MAG: hypothetical protein Ct9H300mP8_01630 [Gammaproteobacteria bacterium]|nr:MAG: hypothetical protein Ct9H300mP8_01630 [Gammaproteobacteria bacterium]
MSDVCRVAAGGDSSFWGCVYGSRGVVRIVKPSAHGAGRHPAWVDWVAVALVPGGQPIGVMAMLGLIVLAGVAVNDAVLLLATARRLMTEGDRASTPWPKPLA